MDKSACKAIVDANIRRLMWETQTQDWGVTIDYGRTGIDDTIAQVEKQTKYRRATITIDHDEHDDEAHVLNSLRHELLHIVLAPFDRLVTLCEHLIGDDQKMLAAVRACWSDVHETTVGNLERLLNRIGTDSPWADEPPTADVVQ